MARQASYWDGVVEDSRVVRPIRAWRRYMLGVYRGLVEGWLPRGDGKVILKTDLFEEAVTPECPIKVLGPGGLGLDLSPKVVQRAAGRLEGDGPGYPLLVGDLRLIPLKAGSVHGILSGSSLDHFEDRSDLFAGLDELCRVLAPGGRLVVTLDNPRNPVVWLRNRLPCGILRRLGLVPYYMGTTCGRRELRRALEERGLTVVREEAVGHAPRLPAVALARMADTLGLGRLESRLAGFLARFEVLGKWPGSWLTGYYVAAWAEKPGGGSGRRAACRTTRD